MDSSKRSSTGCTTCLRYFLLIANLLFIVIGAGVAAIFIYTQVTQVDFVSTVLGTDLVIAANSLLIAGGCLLLIAAVIGIPAGVTRVPAAIATEFALLIIVFLSLMAGIICALVFRTWLTDEVRHGMRNTLQLKYGVNDKVTSNWDKAQYMWKCCAIEDQSWSTYINTEWYKQQPGTPGIAQNPKPYVPRSCCVMDSTGNITDENLRVCQTTSDGPPARPMGGQFTGGINPALNYRGCLQSAQDYLIHDNLSWFSVVVVVGCVAAGLVLIGMFVSLLFCVCRRREVRSEKTLVIDDVSAHMLQTLERQY